MFFSEDCQSSAKHHSIRQMECYIARNIPAATNPRWSMISSPSMLFIFTLLSIAFTSKCDQSSQFFILSTKPQPSPKLVNKFIARQRCRHPNTKSAVPEMVILFWISLMIDHRAGENKSGSKLVKRPISRQRGNTMLDFSNWLQHLVSIHWIGRAFDISLQYSGPEFFDFLQFFRGIKGNSCCMYYNISADLDCYSPFFLLHISTVSEFVSRAFSHKSIDFPNSNGFDPILHIFQWS